MVDGNGIYRDFDPNSRKSINTGYLIIPEDVDRVKFIEQCLRTETFSILVEGGAGVLHNCYATKSAINDFVFPLEGQTIGSGVVFSQEPFAGKAVIYGVVSKNGEAELNKQDVVVFKKVRGDNFALISVDGNGQINMDIFGAGSNGELNINVSNDTLSASLKVSVKGDVSIITEGNTNIIASGGNITLETDQNVNITSSRKVNINSKTTILDNGDQPMVRGNILKEELDKTNELVDALKNSILGFIPIPGDGGAAFKSYARSKLNNKSVGNFEEIKSEKTFLK